MVGQPVQVDDLFTILKRGQENRGEKTIDNPSDGGCRIVIGEYVYKPYTPQTPGKVLGIERKVVAGYQGGYVEYFARVKWLNSKTSTVNCLHLSSFTKLIDDHKKKLKTHTSKLPLLAKL